MLDISSVNPDLQLCKALAIYFARLALPVWNKKYPEDSRPEKAIEAAEKVFFAGAGAWAAYAAYAADAADAANAAYYADGGIAAYYAANAAYYAANSAANSAAANAAYYADIVAVAAANALGKDEKSFIHHHLTQLLPLVLLHKLYSRRSLGEPERVFELLPEACREDFLFNLDSLR